MRSGGRLAAVVVFLLSLPVSIQWKSNEATQPRRSPRSATESAEKGDSENPRTVTDTQTGSVKVYTNRKARTPMPSFARNSGRPGGKPERTLGKG